MNERREKSAVDHSPVGDEDSAVEPASSVEHEIDEPGGGADDNVPGGGSINSVEHELDDPGGVPEGPWVFEFSFSFYLSARAVFADLYLSTRF